MEIMLKTSRRIYSHRFPAREVSAQKRLASGSPASQLITIELLMTDFKSPCVRLEQEPADGSGKVPPVAMIANEILVQVHDGVSQEQLTELLRSRRLDGPLRKLRLKDTYLLELPQLSSTGGEETVRGLHRALEYMNSRPSIVNYAEPNYLYFKCVKPPNDPDLSKLWGLHNEAVYVGKPGADIHAFEGWAIAHESPSVVVAVVDTGIDYKHPDLKANMWKNKAKGTTSANNRFGYNYYDHNGNPMDTDGHGTHVAGTLGARGNNRKGVIGVTWKVQLMALKFVQSWGGTNADASDAIDHAAAQQVAVVVGSWGSFQAISQTLRNAIAKAESQNVLMVFAAGNDGQDTDAVPFYPASYNSPNIISVTATNEYDDFANKDYGEKTVDIAAPGISIYSTYPGKKYQTLDGTSMAVPFVAGACALVCEKNPGASAAAIKDVILKSADRLCSLKKKCVTEGRLNLFTALTTPP